MDNQPCSTNDMISPKVNEVGEHTRGEQGGHTCNSPALTCSTSACSTHTISIQRLIYNDSHTRQTKDKEQK